MRRVVSITAIGLAVLATAGCGVQQDSHDRLLVTNRTLQEQLRSTQRELDTAQANLTTAKAEIGTLQSEMGKLEGAIGTQAAQSDKLLRQVRQFGPLPIDLELALDQVANTHPDLLTFDSRLGMLRFSSDFSFDSGSAELRPDAVTTIGTIAAIIDSTEAQSFEIHLIGYTDNVPIGKPDTRRQHPTNLHLSVHRAIAVQKALTSAGVDGDRIMVAGFGEHRPLVPNPAKGGAAENRRVELLFVPVARTQAEPETAEIQAFPDVPSK